VGEEDKLLSVCSTIGLCFCHSQMAVCKNIQSKTSKGMQFLSGGKIVPFLFVSLGYLGQVKDLFSSSMV